MKKILFSALVLSLAACSGTGSKNTGGGALGGLGSAVGSVASGGKASPSTDGKVAAGMDLAKAATVSESDLINASKQMRAYEDKKRTVAPAGNKYSARLAKLTSRHKNEDGMQLNFKVYMSNEVNANASPDGSVRFYSGLMDKMNDAELLGVIGHEIGHVKFKHAMSEMRTAYMASAARKGAAASGGAVGTIAASDLGGMAEAVLNAQYSQSQETESDDYGLAFLQRHKYDAKAMESAFRKLGSGGGGMLSSHPNSEKRADRMRDKLAAK
jgi:metalloprotease